MCCILLDTLDTFGPKVELLGKHRGKTGHLLLSDGRRIIASTNTTPGHLAVDKSQKLSELQSLPMLLKDLTQVLDVPGAIYGFTVRVISFSEQHK